jgi:hypothetical protein
MGLVAVATLQFAAAGTAAAALPHIKSGSVFTAEISGNGCEILTFSTSTFVADKFGDGGTWSLPSTSTVKLVWTVGLNQRLKFKGTWTTSPVKEYAGTFTIGLMTYSGGLVKGPVAGAGC